MIRRLIILGTLLCFVPILVSAQGFRIGDNAPITSSLTAPGVISTLPATINICNSPANAVPCTNKATTFTSVTLATPCSTSTQVVLAGTSTCVANTDSRGNWGAWVAPGNYDFTVTTTTGSSFGPYTISAGIPPGSNISPGNLTVSGQAVITNPCTVGGFIYVSTGGCYTTIPQAIAAFTGGNCGTIYLPVGTQTTNITINSSNACSNSSSQMVIQGSGRRSTFLKPASNAAVITIDSTAAGVQSVTIRDVGFDNTGSGFTQPAILIQGTNLNDHHQFNRLFFKGFTDTINVTGRMVWGDFENIEIQNDTDVPINVNTGANAFNFNKFHHITLTGTAGLWSVLLNCTGGANCGGAGTYIKNEFDFLDEEAPGGVSTGGISLVNTDNTKVNVYCESLNNPCISVSGTIGRGLDIRGWMHNNGAGNLMSFTASQLSGQLCGATLSPAGGGQSYVQNTTGSGNGLFICPGNTDTGSHTITADANSNYHTTVYGAYPPQTITTTGSQTPSVANINHLRYLNASAATITNFTNPDPGQVLTVFNEGSSTLTFPHSNSAGLFMPNATSVTIGNAGFCSFFFEPFNTRWVNYGCIGGQPIGNAFGANTLTLKKGSGGGNYTNATTTYAVADSTNLCYTVTIPVGWKLGISAQGALATATAAVVAQAALTDNASCSTANSGILVETAPIQGAGIGIADAFALDWVITGDGNSHNVAMQFKTSNAADTASLINSSPTIVPTMKFELIPSN